MKGMVESIVNTGIMNSSQPFIVVVIIIIIIIIIITAIAVTITVIPY